MFKGTGLNAPVTILVLQVVKPFKSAEENILLKHHEGSFQSN